MPHPAFDIPQFRYISHRNPSFDHQTRLPNYIHQYTIALFYSPRNKSYRNAVPHLILILRSLGVSPLPLSKHLRHSSQRKDPQERTMFSMQTEGPGHKDLGGVSYEYGDGKGEGCRPESRGLDVLDLLSWPWEVQFLGGVLLRRCCLGSWLG